MEVLDIKVNNGMSHLSEEDMVALKEYKLIDTNTLQWIQHLYRDIPYKLELGIEVEKIKFYITKNWQVLANNTSEKKILSVFDGVLERINRDRKDRLSKTAHDNMTDILTSMGVIQQHHSLSRYQKIVITISGATGFVIGLFSYLNWIK